ncbi:MAG: acetolactate synthase large subunit, partial [Pseudomonadota bacterium]
MVNVVGDHATYHMRYNSPLKGDVPGVARPVSQWVRSSASAAEVATDGAAALAAARAQNGQIATLILPANTAWEAAEGPAPTPAPPARQRPSDAAIRAAAEALKAPGAALLVGGAGLHGEGAERAGRIATATGCRLLADLFVPRIERGAGAVAFERLPYPIDGIVEMLQGTRHLFLLGAKRPIAFFAYPGKPSTPEPADCPLTEICSPEMDIDWTLQALVAELGAEAATPPRITREIPPPHTGPLTVEAAGQAIAEHLPEGAILVDESVTAGRIISPLTRH